MTPKEIAEKVLDPNVDVIPTAWLCHLAQAYLALESRIQKLEAVAEAARNLHEECHRISVETDAPNTQAMACLWRVIEELERE